MSNLTEIAGADQTQTVAVASSKNTRATFLYTGKPYPVKSKEFPDGMNPSAAAWLDVLKALGRPMTRAECVNAMTGTNIHTTQPPIRVIYYWKKYLVDGGWITICKSGSEPVAQPVPAEATDASDTVPSPVLP